MKNFWRTALSMVLTTSMIASSVPVSIQAAQSSQKTMKKSIEKVEAIDKTKAEKKKDVQQYAEGEAIVLYKGSTSKVKTFSQKGKFGDDLEVVETYQFTGKGNVSKKSNQSGESVAVSLVKSKKYSTKELVEKLKKRDDVTYAEPNYRIKASGVSDDAYADYQWALDNQGQNGGTEGLDINADTSVLKKDADSKERVIALVDTGIDYTHEDLKNVVWNNPFANTNKLRGQHGYDFINYDADPLDDNGHGSHCSGIMAGTADNKVGISGVATSDNVKIMGLKILDAEGYGYGFEAIGAYNYIYKAQQLGVNVVAVNNSWGGVGEEESQILELLINMVGEKGAISVCAAGNEGEDNDIVESLPCNIDSPYVISVAATNEKDEITTFSNYGSKSVDIAAPGADILSSVSYDSFNPGIYENKDEFCSVYEDFSKSSLVSGSAIGTASSSAIGEDEVAYSLGGEGDNSKVSVNLNSKDYFGEKEQKAKSLEWTIKGAEVGEIYHIYLPYTAKVSDTPVYNSMMVKIQAPDFVLNEDDIFSFFDSPSEFYIADSTMEDGTYNEDKETLLGGTYAYGNNNYWNHFSEQRTNKVTKEENRVVALQLYINTAGDYTIHLDDLGISQSNIKSEKFGKYDFYNGTSMATPYVTGAVAAVANVYPNETTEQIKARILGSVRQADGLKGKVGTAGVLDLSKVTNPNPYVDKVALNKDNNIEITGSFLKNTTVKANGTVVKEQEKTDNKIVLDSDKLLKKKLKIEVSEKDYAVSNDYFFSTGKSADTVGTIENVFYGGNVTTDGEKLYYVDESGAVYTSDLKQELFVYSENIENELTGEMGTEMLPQTTGFTWDNLGGCFNPVDIFGEGYATTIDFGIGKGTDVIVCNKKLWTIVHVSLGYAEETALVYFDEVTKKWVNACNIPDSCSDTAAPILTSYNGEIYLIGGVNATSMEASTKVFSYDKDKKVWKSGVDLPEGRYASKALQVGDKLVITLGGNNKKECPANLIFDGKVWTISKAKLAPFEESFIYASEERGAEIKELPYYTAQIGLINNGIVYSGIQADEVGDTFKYNMEKDIYETLEYSVFNEMQKDEFFATAIGDKFYVIYGDYIEYDFDDEEEYASKSVYEAYEEEVPAEPDNSFSVAAIPVESGCIKVQDSSTEGGMVQGTGNYLPGDIIELTPIVISNDYFVKQFLVNGKVVKGNSYRCNAKDDIDASVVTGAYATNVMINPFSAEVKVGETLQLSASVFPENADNKKVEWESDNVDVAVVDQNGKVTVTSVKGGEQVTITAKVVGYSDYIVSTCTLKVKAVPTAKPTIKPTKKPVVKVKKIKLTPTKKTVKAGAKFQIKAVVSPSNAKNKKIIWATSNKRYAVVNKNGKVTTKKAGKGKTVTITAKAADGSKVIKKIKVKIK